MFDQGPHSETTLLPPALRLDSDLDCADGRCALTCSGFTSCQDSTAVCPADHDCELDCPGVQSCAGIEVSGPGISGTVSQ